MSRVAAVLALAALLLTPVMAWVCELRCAGDDVPAVGASTELPTATQAMLQTPDDCAGRGLEHAPMIAAVRVSFDVAWMPAALPVVAPVRAAIQFSQATVSERRAFSGSPPSDTRPLALRI